MLVSSVGMPLCIIAMGKSPFFHTAAHLINDYHFLISESCVGFFYCGLIMAISNFSFPFSCTVQMGRINPPYAAILM